MTALGTRQSYRSNKVVACFRDWVLAFELPQGATLADLAERLASFERRMDEMPIGIAVWPAR